MSSYPMAFKTNYQYKAFSLLEVIFTVAILLIGSIAILNLFNLVVKMNWENKARVGAIQLANKKIEIARNLPYDDVGTVGGIVAGTIPENETVILNGIEYNIYTNVAYVDDPFDGTWDSDPPDTLTNDYKRVLVRVSWDSEFSSSPVEFYTDIAPNGVESNLGGGTIVINVFNASGLPVDAASIHIYNPSVSPAVDMNTFSNSQGQLVLPGVLEAIESYEITVTKSGYSTDKTYAATVDLPTPDKPHLTVFEGKTTSVSFSIDKTADMLISVKDINGVSLGNIPVHIWGNKRIGLDGEGEPVYKFDDSRESDASGQIALNSIEWDNYQIEVASSTGYDVKEIDPPLPIELLPTDNKQVTVTLEPSADNSLLAIVKDENDQPVDGATVHVTNVLGYDKTLVTGTAGQAFFSPLDNATTTIEVSKSGYETYSNEILLYGYTYEPVILSVP